MNDLSLLVKAGRHLLRDNPRQTEPEFRNLMLARFRANDQRLQQDNANMTGGPADALGGVFSALMLPWIVFRWLGWRGRLARHRAEIDEVVRVLRREGCFASESA